MAAVRRARDRLTFANVVSVIALFAAIGGGTIAIAARHPAGRRGRIRACYVKRGRGRGRIRLLVRGRCRRNERKLVWNRRGRRGPRGRAGAAGLAGAVGPRGAQGAPGAPAWSADCQQGLPAGEAMVRVGPICIDRYENSVWTARAGGSQITGAIPCGIYGQDCEGKIFARSVPGVAPRVSITWFQAQQALANSGKRLPSNGEWQMAVSGTPESPVCNIVSGSLAATGSYAGCVSDWGAMDMVGNAEEWVADWVPRSTSCEGSWPGSSDDQCLVGAATAGEPGAMIRGGGSESGAAAGPRAILGFIEPTRVAGGIGFRGAR